MDCMKSFYPDGYHHGRDTIEHTRRYKIQSDMLPSLGDTKVLDVGCANGDFLNYLLQEGNDFEAHGLDAHAQGTVNEKIVFEKGTLPNGVYAADSFDVVMAWAVFEHLHSPMQYFAEASRILKSRGLLIILVTNSNSIYGRFAYAEDVPRHTYHFSRKTLIAYGERNELEMVDLDHRDDIFDGRGMGCFNFLLGRAVGLTWKKIMSNEISTVQQAFRRIGSLIDRMIFSWHWESKMGISGIMIATYRKK
jgi:SAM-dependent methyltransferase|tara:strand:+ start:6341 stop:7087 length:747 start_codon:yes stop_codon:yes gene_type:complete